MAFQGYTQETVDFLWGIRFNNERGWFMEHKQDYQEHLLAPTRALAEQVYDAIHEMCPDDPFLLKLSASTGTPGGSTGRGRIRITCGSASAPAIRTGQAAPPSILRSGRTITATAWASGVPARR